MVSTSPKELLQLIRSDLFRYNGQSDIKSFLKNFLINRGFKITVYYRIGHFLFRINSILLKPFTLFYILKCNKYTVNISLKTSIGFGFYLGHPFAVAISRYAKLGNNVNISQGVTIGQKQSQSEILAPTIGNNVYVGPGCNAPQN